MTRISKLPPEGSALQSWIDRSSFVLGAYADDHDATLEGFGIARGIDRGTVGSFLAVHDARAREEGRWGRGDGFVGVPKPDGAVSAHLRLPETVALVAAARRIAEELDCAPGPVVGFLLTGRAFALPWLEVETLAGTAEGLGPGFRIRVGSSDVTAEEVRRAYVEAVRAATGGDGSRPLPEHVYSLIYQEVEGRLAGLTWTERWDAWRRFAREWAITGHDYVSVESYRNYVKKLRDRLAWVRRALEEAEREHQTAKETG